MFVRAVYIVAVFSYPLLFAAGCATVTSKPEPATVYSVDKVSNTKGFRYYLPKPYLLLTPSASGKNLSVTTFLAPDYERAYYIDSQALLAANKFDLGITNGMLQKVSTESNTTSVADAMISGYGELLKAQLQATPTGDPSAAASLTARLQEINALIEQLKKLRDSVDDSEAEKKAFYETQIGEWNGKARTISESMIQGGTPAKKVLPAKPKLFEIRGTRTALTLEPVDSN